MDVVQKYSLPKFQHPIVHPVSNPAFKPTADRLEEELEEDEPRLHLIGLGASASDPSEDEIDVVRDDMESMRMKNGRQRVPMTMAELAAEAKEDSDDDDEDGMEDVTRPSPVQPANRPTLRSTSSVQPNSLAAAASPATRRRTSARVSKATSSSPATAISKVSSRKRPRARRSTASSVTTAGDRDDDDADEDSGAPQSSGEEDDEEVQEVKRRRPPIRPTDISTPARALRPRRGRTEAQIREEQERERAYRLAVAE